MDLGFDVVVTVTGIVLVFLILVLLMAIITLEGKIFDGLGKKKVAAKAAASVFSRSFRGSALAASNASVLTLAISVMRKCLLGCPQTRWTSGHRDQKKYCLRRRP